MKEIMIDVITASFAYDDEERNAVNQVNMNVRKGEFLAILGKNGSGKSTLAKLMNGLYIPTKGQVKVCTMDTADDEYTWEIRKKAGMVFQNPDNQLVATIVTDDVAFGLENIGIKTEEMPERIEEALENVGMLSYKDRAPHLLSGGQKQRVAIAGILAMRPEIIIFDEATAMLDPKGRKEVFEAVTRLNKEHNITVVWITHIMQEAAQCDYIYVCDEAEIVFSGTPKEVFQDTEKMRNLRLDVPPMAYLSQQLRNQGIPLPTGILTVEEMVEGVKMICN